MLYEVITKKSELKAIEKIFSRDYQFLRCSDIADNVAEEDNYIAKEHSSYLSNILSSPQFKDTSSNIKGLWDNASSGFKDSSKTRIEYNVITSYSIHYTKLYD